MLGSGTLFVLLMTVFHLRFSCNELHVVEAWKGVFADFFRMSMFHSQAPMYPDRYNFRVQAK
jgi:hypothetical protein